MASISSSPSDSDLVTMQANNRVVTLQLVLQLILERSLDLIHLLGNLCHNDCSNRGICDYTTGTCTCFTGYYSSNCALTSALAL